MKTIKLNGKPVEFLVTAAFDGKYSLELGTSNYIPYVKLAEKALSMFPADMYLFEMKDKNVLQVRSAGYTITKDPNDSILNEKKIILTVSIEMQIDTFWLKLNDYGDKYVGMFMFPSDW